MPRRFGATEPLRGRLDGDDAFRAAYASADTLLAHAGTAPTLRGTLGTPNLRDRLGPMMRVDPADWIDSRPVARLDEIEPSRRVAARVPRSLRTRPWRL